MDRWGRRGLNGVYNCFVKNLKVTAITLTYSQDSQLYLYIMFVPYHHHLLTYLPTYLPLNAYYFKSDCANIMVISVFVVGW